MALRLVAARLLLVVLVLLAQLGAHVHAIGHATEAPPHRSTQADAQGDSDGGSHLAGFCAECLALGSLALAAHAVCVPLGHASFDLPAPPATAAAVAAALPPRCRAPPAEP